MSEISIPANAPVGGISFTNPPATAISYYKLASNIPITFGWNLTSLYVTPTSLTFSAYCSSNGNTYPVGPTSVPATATQLIWQPWTYQTAQGVQTPLVQGTYTLQVQDEQGTTAVGSPGLFQYNDQMTFAFYTPQPYTPLSRELRFRFKMIVFSRRMEDPFGPLSAFRHFRDLILMNMF